jgi:hypothetical protein
MNEEEKNIAERYQVVGFLLGIIAGSVLTLAVQLIVFG